MPRVTQFEDVMNFLPRSKFDRWVAQNKSDKHSKGFSCWQLLLALVYGQLSGATSLRTLAARLNQQSVRARHRLPMHATPRSTLSDALAKREVAVFSEAAQFLIRAVGRRTRQHAGQLLYLLDSTSITLKGRGFDDWTHATRAQHTQGIKRHVLTHQGTPLSYSISAANVNDITPAKDLSIAPQATYVFDKGYCDDNWWKQLQDHGAFFVTRFKYNANLHVQSANPIATEAAQTILADEVVRFTNTHPGGGRRNQYTQALRRILVARSGERPLILATNDRHY